MASVLIPQICLVEATRINTRPHVGHCVRMAASRAIRQRVSDWDKKCSFIVFSPLRLLSCTGMRVFVLYKREWSLMYIYEMYEKGVWPFSVIAGSFPCPIRALSHNHSDFFSTSPKTLILFFLHHLYDGVHSVCPLLKPHVCSDRPGFIVELRFHWIRSELMPQLWQSRCVMGVSVELGASQSLGFTLQPY